MIQYGVWNNHTDELWRGPYQTETEARTWIDEWLEDGGVQDLFSVCVQIVSDWRIVKPRVDRRR